jgi:tripartite-type tricarboxylate transporter receptor subunit TctC
VLLRSLVIPLCLVSCAAFAQQYPARPVRVLIPFTAGSAADIIARAMEPAMMVHVPHKGAAEALASLLGGQTDLMFASLSSSIPLIRAGKLRAFAVTGARRSPSIPELPTVAEAANLQGYAASAWFGIVGPAGMPKAAVGALNKAALSSLEDAEVRKRLFNAGVEIRTSTPDEFAKYIASEMLKWDKVVRASGAKVD